MRKSKRAVAEPASLPTTNERLNLLQEAVQADLLALCLKHGLVTFISVVSVPADVGHQWALITVGDSSSAETMLAWALGHTTVQRQAQMRKLMMDGVLVDRS